MKILIRAETLIVNNINRSKYIFGKQQDDEYYFQLYIRTYFPKSWTLESKSECIVENNIYHLVIFQKSVCLYLYYLQLRHLTSLSGSMIFDTFLT